MKKSTLIVLIVSLILMAIAAFSDFSGNRYWFSREIYWNAALYFLVLAIFLELYNAGTGVKTFLNI